MKNEIKYIGYYFNNEKYNESRNYSLAATNKMDYICRALGRNGYRVLIVSPSRTSSKCFYKGKRVKVNKFTKLHYFPTFPWGNKLQKVFSIIAGDIMLLWFLITQVKKNETILVYHSLELGRVVDFAKKIKGFNIVLEVEEIYQDVVSCSKLTKKNEYKTFNEADKYIFPTELLNRKINKSNKPYTITHGTYQVEEDRGVKFNDGKVHVVYAGTFDPRKGGAIAAAAAAEYLPDNYHVHIIGFGSKHNTEQLKNTINEIKTKTEATITYDGLFSGEDYIEFLQKCDIGLSTQIPDAKYNNTSFPSKILSYMANGLRVVTVRIEAIEKSAIGNAVYYYNEQTPKAIAEAIMAIDVNEPYDSRKLIKELDVKFTKNIKELLEN